MVFVLMRIARANDVLTAIPDVSPRSAESSFKRLQLESALHGAVKVNVNRRVQTQHFNGESLLQL